MITISKISQHEDYRPTCVLLELTADSSPLIIYVPWTILWRTAFPNKLQASRNHEAPAVIHRNQIYVWCLDVSLS